MKNKDNKMKNKDNKITHRMNEILTSSKFCSCHFCSCQEIFQITLLCDRHKIKSAPVITIFQLTSVQLKKRQKEISI